MEVHELCAILKASISPNVEELKRAETLLKQNEATVGHGSNLLRIVVEESLGSVIRLSAAISLKRIVQRIWDPVDENERCLPEEDKAQIKGSVLEALIRSPDTKRIWSRANDVTLVVSHLSVTSIRFSRT